MTVLTDLLADSEPAPVPGRDGPVLDDLLAQPQPAAPGDTGRADTRGADTRRRDMTGAPVDPEAGVLDMTGVPFPSASGERAPTRVTRSGGRLGGGYVTALITLTLIVAGLATIIRSHNPTPSAAPATAAR